MLQWFIRFPAFTEITEITEFNGSSTLFEKHSIVYISIDLFGGSAQILFPNVGISLNSH